MGIKGIRELYPQPNTNKDEAQFMANIEPNYDDTDVEEALKRETADGSGFESEDELPDSDFDGFPEADVENDFDGDNEPAVEEDGQ